MCLLALGMPCDVHRAKLKCCAGLTRAKELAVVVATPAALEISVKGAATDSRACCLQVIVLVKAAKRITRVKILQPLQQ